MFANACLAWLNIIICYETSNSSKDVLAFANGRKYYISKSILLSLCGSNVYDHYVLIVAYRTYMYVAHFRIFRTISYQTRSQPIKNQSMQ